MYYINKYKTIAITASCPGILNIMKSMFQVTHDPTQLGIKIIWST